VRIGELSEVTGVTVRTIRYYHQFGLLPVPPRRDGRRDYDLGHVARIARIRWLAQAGIPLARIATMLTGQPEQAPAPVVAGRAEIVADLHAGVTALDEQLAELRVQRQRMTALIDAIGQHGRLSPMPAAMVRFYDHMDAKAPDDRTRRVIRRERDFMELAYYRGDMPPQAEALYEALSDAHLADSAALFGRIADRYDRPDLLDDSQIEQIAQAVVDRIARHLGADLPTVLGSIDIEVARRAADLYVRLSDPCHRRLDRAIADALLTAIEKGHLA
jgi:DNA-binding transcriptional MerR regulator